MCTSAGEVVTVVYVVFAFCSAFMVGALKGLLVGPIAGLIIIVGNTSVILGLLPCHLAWAAHAIVLTKRFDNALKLALLISLAPLFAIWLGLSITGTVLVGVGYGFFTPWVSAFEAFRQGRELKKFLHSAVDGTWDTIKGSCTLVRDFCDLCYYAYPQFLKEMHQGSGSDQIYTVKFIQVPGIIAVGLMGLIVEIPLYTAIAVLKSPYMLFKGWQRLLHDLIGREGPFLETACVPVAGLTIILWPLVVIGSVLLAIFSSFFVGLYGSVIAYQERSFKRGVAYIIAMVSEFDEYTNDWLYLREGSFLPKPHYRRKKASQSSELSVGGSNRFTAGSSTAPPMLVPTLAPSRSVREAIQEVKMVQIWEDVMKSSELRGRELIDANMITAGDLCEWIKAKSWNQGNIVGLGIPAYTLFKCLLHSAKSGSSGLVLSDGTHITQQNRPQDRLMDWFFHPLLVLKEQIKVIKMSEGEMRYLEKLTIFSDHPERMDSWENGSVVPQDPLRLAQIQGISRRLMGMTRSSTKFPTHRRRFRQVVKALLQYISDREGSTASHCTKSVPSIEAV